MIEATLEDEPLVDDEREMAVRVVSEPGNKWRLNDGVHTFWARMEDHGFVDRVQGSQESFRAGDILICRVRIRQWETETGLRADGMGEEVRYRRGSVARAILIPAP